MPQHCHRQGRIIRLMHARHAGQGQVQLSSGIAVMQAAIIYRGIPAFTARMYVCVVHRRLRSNGVCHRRAIFLRD